MNEWGKGQHMFPLGPQNFLLTPNLPFLLFLVKVDQFNLSCPPPPPLSFPDPVLHLGDQLDALGLTEI